MTYIDDYWGINRKRKGVLYNDADAKKYQVDIVHPFHDTTETFEVYECPKCNGHFLVESDAVESTSYIYCPYCKYKFTEGN